MGFFVLFVHFRGSGSEFDGFKREKQQGDGSECSGEGSFCLYLGSKVFLSFLVPDVLAAQITHLEEQCSKKL